MIDIMVVEIEGDAVIARRVRTEAERRNGVCYPRIIWATLLELGMRPRLGEVFGIAESDYHGCEVQP